MLENQGISREFTFNTSSNLVFRPDHRQEPPVDILGFHFKPKPQTQRLKPNVADCITAAAVRDFEKKEHATGRKDNIVKNRERISYNLVAPTTKHIVL